MVESERDNPRTVEQIVRSRLIENWESQDEPEHFRTIRDRILRDEQRASYLLELYQQIRVTEEQSEITADDTQEQSELQLSGLVVREQNKLRVYNLIYKEIFEQNWIETQLRNLRPYSEIFKFWVASGGSDDSRLLRGKALQDALEWAKDKSLNYQDRQFLAASQAKEREEEIAALEKEAALERERKDREAVEKRNLVLSEANQQAKKRIRNGTVVLFLTVLGAIISVTMAANKVTEAQKKLQETYTYVAYPKQLIELEEKLTGKGLKNEADEISEKANIKIKDPQLEQVHLHTSKSLAYQYLKDWKSAEESINQSTNFFRGWKFNKSKKEQSESNSEFLQTEIFVLTVQGNLFRERNQTPLAREAYQKAFNLLQSNSNQLNPLKKKPQIINTTTVERVHRGLIELLTTKSTQGNDFLSQVRQSLKEHYYAELDNLLENRKWEAADRLTSKLMLYITKTETQGYLNTEDIKKLSCPDLIRIDASWKKNSDGHFGFGVQKKIWLDTGNRQEYNEQAFDKFLSQLQWNKWDYDMIIREVEKDYSKAPMGILPIYVYPWQWENYDGIATPTLFSRTCLPTVTYKRSSPL